MPGPGKAHGLSCPPELPSRVHASLLSVLSICKPTYNPGQVGKGWPPAALHVLWGLEAGLVGCSLGPWGQLGKRPWRSWGLEDAGREESRRKRQEGARGRDGAEGLEVGKGSLRQAATSERAEGLCRGTAVPLPALAPALAAPFPVPPGCRCSRTGLGSRLPLPC